MTVSGCVGNISANTYLIRILISASFNITIEQVSTFPVHLHNTILSV